MRAVTINPRPRALCCAAALCALGALGAGCGPAASTSTFHGESHAVAQTVSEFQSNANSRNQAHICEHIITAELRSALTAPHRSCAKALEEQLAQVDNFTISIESISVRGPRATARVKSTWSGREALSTLALVKEAGRWRIAALQ
ncbi:MAG: nuclear transport factor 2 family protein [Solirubrobacterales bacterium]|nr:nuclear transport factor 2 family protein [Solirubrobacterales bacterium]